MVPSASSAAVAAATATTGARMQAPPLVLATRGPHHHHPRCCPPAAWRDPEKNLLSGVVSVAVVVVVCVAVFHPRWFWLEGGGCNTSTLSLCLFFLAGKFVPGNGSSSHYIYLINDERLDSCVTPTIVSLLQVVIGLAFLMVCASVVQIELDLAGSAGKAIKCLRKNSVPSIMAVWVCVVCVGVCYLLTTLLEELQVATKPMPTARVMVQFDLGFYLLVLAGGLAVLAVGCSWLRPMHIFQEGDSAPLMEDYGLGGLETPVPSGSSLPSNYPYMIDREPPPPVEGNPPPPYTP